MRRMNQTVASLEALGNHLSGIHGRKNLVWISGGLAVLHTGRAGSLGQQLRVSGARPGAAAGDAGITVYPVQAAGLQLGILGTRTTAPSSSKGQDGKGGLAPDDERKRSAHLGHDGYAGRDDGRPCRSGIRTSSRPACVPPQRICADRIRSASVPESSDNRWREFEVPVSRPGIRVLHRKGYMALAR